MVRVFEISVGVTVGWGAVSGTKTQGGGRPVGAKCLMQYPRSPGLDRICPESLEDSEKSCPSPLSLVSASLLSRVISGWFFDGTFYFSDQILISSS